MKKLLCAIGMSCLILSNGALAELALNQSGDLIFRDGAGTAEFALTSTSNPSREAAKFSVQRVSNYVCLFEYAQVGFGEGWLTVFPIGRIDANNQVQLFDGYNASGKERSVLITSSSSTYSTTGDVSFSKLNAASNKSMKLEQMIAHAMTDHTYAANAGRDAERYQQLSPTRFLERYLQWRKTITDTSMRAEYDALVATRFAEAKMKDFFVQREIQAETGLQLAALTLLPQVNARMSPGAKIALQDFLHSIRTASQSSDYSTRSKATAVLEKHREILNRLDAVLAGRPDPSPQATDAASECGYLAGLFGRG